MRTYNLKQILILLVLGLFSLPAFAALDVEPAPISTSLEIPRGPCCNNLCDRYGLYATITGYLKIKNVNVPNQRIIQIDVPSFTKPVPARVVMQDQVAPLVVILPGIAGAADEDFNKLWPQWYSEAGFHVLSLNSTFRNEFLDIAGRGVAGNLFSETEAVAEIIDNFLKRPDVDGKVSQLGIVGMSYGGIQALILGKMARNGQLPFTIDAIQAYSPPLKLDRTAKILDTWYNEDRWIYTLVELQMRVGTHKPIENPTCIPFSAPIMRAAIAASFHEGLVPVVKYNDEKFKLGLLPPGNQYDDGDLRAQYANVWGFQKYAYDMALPFWQRKSGAENIDRMITDSYLYELVYDQPPNTEIVIAADDPFNDPDDLRQFQSAGRGKHVVYLPRGGHLGYIGEDWTRENLLSLFGGHVAAR